MKTKTKTLWWRNPRYVYDDLGIESHTDLTLNLMQVAKTFCYSSGWENPKLMKLVWKNTAYAGRQKGKFEFSISQCVWGKNYGASRKYYAPYIRIRKGWSLDDGYYDGNAHSTGRASATYGVSMTTGFNPADALVTLLHELCHVNQQGEYAKVNGKQRPHDLEFNCQQWKMAKKFWGYDFHPESVGWSVGKGYAPTIHMAKWLHTEIYENKNEKILTFIQNIQD